jgi:hypothetical protein
VTSVNAEVIRFPRQRQDSPAYSLGFQDGMRIGSRVASERFFWFGVAAGVGISGLIAVVLIRLVS